jgi:hypothetical protein
MIFEVGNEDPIIYTKEDILKELSNMKQFQHMSEKEMIDRWVKIYKAARITE